MQTTEKPKPSKMVSFRLPTKHIELLADLAAHTSQSKSELLRQGIERLAADQHPPVKESF